MKILIFIIFYIFNLYFSGSYIARKAKISDNPIAFVSIGFVFQLAIIQFLGWWMVAFQMPTYLFMFMMICVMLAFMILGMKKEEHVIAGYYDKKFCINQQHIILMILLCVLFVELLLLYRSDADDSFYVSNVLLFSQSDILNPYDSSFGNKDLGTVPMYDFQIWESYLAILCKLFSIKASVMCHFVMIFVLLAIAVSAYICLGETIFREKEKSILFTNFLLLFYTFGGYAVYSKGSFLLSRIWQGKATYLHIVLPIAIAIMVRYFEDPKTFKNMWLYLVLVMLAGISLNPTSMYVIGFQIIFMMVVIAINRKSWNSFLHMLPSVLVIGLFSMMVLMRTSQYDGQIEAASSTGEEFAYNTFKSFLGTGVGYFIIYLICCFLIMIYGEKKGKIFCIYTPIALFLGIWNPIMAPLVAENLTMVPSYWRVFWLLPIDFAIAYVGVIFWKKKNIIAICLLSFLIIISGEYMFTTENNFIKAENTERIPPEVLQFGETIMQSNGLIVLANENASTTLRQEFNDIELIFSRYQYILDLIMYRGNELEATERIQMMNFVNGTDLSLDYNHILMLLEKYNVEWIIIDVANDTSCDVLLNNGYIVENEMNNTLLLRKSQ